MNPRVLNMPAGYKRSRAALGEKRANSSPQWHIIERVTAGRVLLAGGQRDEAEDALRTALAAAEVGRLPHQIQRTIRAADAGQLDGVALDCRATLDRLNESLTLTPPTPDSQ